MAIITIEDLTFSYDTSAEDIFSHLSLQLSTDWRLGLIGRNGRGKTTFLNLLMGKYPYRGLISSPVSFDYFPFEVENPERPALQVALEAVAPFTRWEVQMEALLADGSPDMLVQYGQVLEQYEASDGYCIDELLKREANLLQVSPGALARPFDTLSFGERTKLLLAALFLRKNRFLLIDEPTNHLDAQGRRAVAQYLRSKSGFLLVSHDRAVLNEAVDHILSFNRSTITLQKGNYDVWEENRKRLDQFEAAQSQRLQKDIRRLNEAAARSADWSGRVEKEKIGSRNSGLRPDRGYLGHKSAKLMKRAKAAEQRLTKAAEEKEALLKDLETKDALKIVTLKPPKPRLLEATGLSLRFGGHTVFDHLSFTVEAGDRVALIGPNGCGKSSLLKLLLGEPLPCEGACRLMSGLTLSYVPQDTSFLSGSLRDFLLSRSLDEPLFKAILRKLDFSRAQFEKRLEELSAGQKKKVLLAASLSKPAHLYLWDEPLNFIDILSRVQLEELLLACKPTILFVEHDAVFADHVATKRVELGI